MTLSQFSSQSLGRRVHLVLTQGKLLAVRQDNRACCVFLYHLHGFFAEVWHSAVERRVLAAHGFENTRILEPYLEQIDISELV